MVVTATETYTDAVTGTNPAGQMTTGQDIGVVTVIVTAGGSAVPETVSTQPGGESTLSSA